MRLRWPSRQSPGAADEAVAAAKAAKAAAKSASSSSSAEGPSPPDEDDSRRRQWESSIKEGWQRGGPVVWIEELRESCRAGRKSGPPCTGWKSAAAAAATRHLSLRNALDGGSGGRWWEGRRLLRGDYARRDSA